MTILSPEAHRRSQRSMLRDVRATAALQAKTPPTIDLSAKPRSPQSRGTLTASAHKLTSKEAQTRSKALGSAGKTASWQEEAWELLDHIGEQRFLAHTLAGRMAQAALYVGKVDPLSSPGTRPEPSKDTKLQELLDAVGDGPAGVGQLINRAGINLFVAGEAWLVGIPPHLVPGTPEHAAATDLTGAQLPIVDRLAAVEEQDVLSMVWRVLSVDEIQVDQAGTAKIALEEGTTLETSIDELFAVRIWRPHPRRAWEADSPTRASLPVLRELFALTQHVGAQIDSRLAGAGLLVVSTSASAAFKRAAGIPEDDPNDPLMDSLVEVMQTAIKERESAAALVPIVLTVPDDVVDKIKHITFSTPLDKEAPNLRDESIRRLALGQDAPPELLLGVGGMNHWGAWLVREDVVKTHLEPPLQLICDALTTDYLRPLMLGMGYSEEQANEYVVWYDVDHLITRPNRGQDAKDLYNLGVVSDRALREANGFEEGDAPEETGVEATDPAVDRALQLIVAAPSLVQDPGLPALVEQIRGVLAGERVSTPEPSAISEPSTEGGLPNTTPEDAPAGTPANPGEAE